MIKVKCFNCKESWNLSTANTNRCPECGWIIEIYYDKIKVEAVRDIYNKHVSNYLTQFAGVLPLIGLDGYSISFPPDEARLIELLEN